MTERCKIHKCFIGKDGCKKCNSAVIKPVETTSINKAKANNNTIKTLIDSISVKNDKTSNIADKIRCIQKDRLKLISKLVTHKNLHENESTYIELADKIHRITGNCYENEISCTTLLDNKDNELKSEWEQNSVVRHLVSKTYAKMYNAVKVSMNVDELDYAIRHIIGCKAIIDVFKNLKEVNDKEIELLDNSITSLDIELSEMYEMLEKTKAEKQELERSLTDNVLELIEEV